MDTYSAAMAQAIKQTEKYNPFRKLRKRSNRQPIQLSRGGTGRNDPCPCGSGNKFKRCHGG